MSRIARALGLGSLGVVAYLAVGDTALAGSACHPGSLNASGTCDCPAGYANVGGAGNAHCESKAPPPPPPPKCGLAGQPPCPSLSQKLPLDAGSTVPVKGGTFMMGDVVSYGATPIRSVTVSDYAIDRYEVSVAEFKKCVDAGVCTAPPTPTGLSTAYRCNFGTGRDAHPMNCVNHQEAMNYCLWKGKRLPTEAEWEFAARGPTSKQYPWGTDAPTCKHANFSQNSGATTAGCGDGTSPIGTHAAGKSTAGAQDMTGNVEEWTSDYYATFNGTMCTNPGGPLTGTSRTVKGSAFDQSAITDQIAARREGVAPGNREPWLGFRCAQGPAPTATPACYNAPVAPTPPTPPPPSTPTDFGSVVKIPGGTFKMGNAAGAETSPERMVTLSSYSIDKYEVTSGDYKKCVVSGSCSTPNNSMSTYCNYDKFGKDNHPVNCVEWADAKKYCAYMGKRLPTEAEWEYAARGSDGRLYPWGFSAPTCSHAAFKQASGTFCGPGGAMGTTAVGAHPLGASYWGAHDMGGNIEEWVYDNYAKYSPGVQVNPSGPMSGTGHVVRGGNWEIGDAEMKTYARYHFDAAKYWIGFRCAKTGN